MFPNEISRLASFSLLCLVEIAFDTIIEPNVFTCVTAFLNFPPKKISVTCQSGFWNLSHVAPDAKSKDLENGCELCISTYRVGIISPIMSAIRMKEFSHVKS